MSSLLVFFVFAAWPFVKMPAAMLLLEEIYPGFDNSD
jgi:hypothetical protein